MPSPIFDLKKKAFVSIWKAMKNKFPTPGHTDS